MKVKAGLVFVLLCANLAAQNNSVSVDPLTLLGLLPARETSGMDIRNMWLCATLNFQTRSQKELGFGVFARADRVALHTHYRSFQNEERLSGFFWGIYGRIEWRQMYWYYNETADLSFGWSFPFRSGGIVYNSAGITAGADIGFRIRINNVGITPYAGVGIPLFLCFGVFPEGEDRRRFRAINALFRAIDVGIRLDFFRASKAL